MGFKTYKAALNFSGLKIFWKSVFIIFVLINRFDLFAQPQPILRSVEFSGNKFISSPVLLNSIKSSVGIEYVENMFKTKLDSIIQLYNKCGFYYVTLRVDSVKAIQENNIDLVVHVDEGVQCRLGDFLISGNNNIETQQLKNILQNLSNNIFDPSSLEEGIEKIVRIYEESGYPYAQANIKSIVPEQKSDSTKLSVELEIEEGDFVTVDQVRLVGNTFTKDDVIVREMRLKPNEPFRASKIRTIKGNLQRLNIFDRVEEPKLFVSDTSHGIFIKLIEGKTNNFDGIIGYNPGSGKNKGFVTGFISIAMRNLFGTGRKLGLSWKHESQSTQEIGANYTEPWLFKIPLSLSGSYNQRKEDTTYVKRDIAIYSEYTVTDAISLGGSVKQEFVIPSENSVNIQKVRTIFGGLSINYDTRDDRYIPTSGVTYKTNYEFGMNDNKHSSKSVQRVGIDFEMYIESLPAQVVSFSLHGKSVTAGNIVISDLYRFGGTNSLRGYRENEFLGSRVAWSNFEYRFLIGFRSYLYGFTDVGYYYRPALISVDILTEKWKIGYGIGARLQTVLGFLGFSFAFGGGDSFMQGKIHIGLINEF
ncbi:MAG: BamA/TamA family outer membrane protein [Ignavibacteriales bacterium]|nr:BamA/TamA family outer membrane protein [Ignavibacteriales bacterium]